MLLLGCLLLTGCGGRDDRASTPEKASVSFESGVLGRDWTSTAFVDGLPNRLNLGQDGHFGLTGRWALIGRDTLRLWPDGTTPEDYLIRGLSGSKLTLVCPDGPDTVSYFAPE